MNGLLMVFLSLSISGVIITLALFIIKPLIRDSFSKTWQYYIWLIVIFRLLMPFTVEFNIIGELFERTRIYTQESGSNIYEQTLYLGDTIPNTSELIDSQVIDSTQNVDTANNTDTNYIQSLGDNLWLFWLVIAIMLFSHKVTSYHNFIQYVKAGRKKVTDTEILLLHNKISECMKIKKVLPLYKNELVSSPMLVGVMQPFIVLPDLDMSKEELRHILHHELTHYKRFDIFYKWLVQIAVCLHWFNPVVYLVSHEISKDCELSCDENIIKQMDENARYSYGDALLSTIKPDGGYSNAVISVTLSDNAKLLKERLGAIMKFRKQSKFTVMLSTFLAVLIFSGSTIIGAYAGSIERDRNDTRSHMSIQEMFEYLDSVFAWIENNSSNIEQAVTVAQAVTEDSARIFDNFAQAAAEAFIGIDWSNVDLSQIYDGEIHSGDVFNSRWLNQFRVNGSMTTYEGTYNNGIFERGVILSGDRIVVVHDNQYIILDNLEDIRKVTTALNINLDDTAIRLIQVFGNWEHMEAYLPFMSNDGIEELVKTYNSNRPASQHKVASDYLN